MSQYELYHHGVKGMHWGVRRYQNRDGTRTTEGKHHYRSIRSNSKPKSAQIGRERTKKFVAAALVSGTVSAAAVYCAKNPQAVKAAGKVISSVGKTTINSLKSSGSKTVSLGKKYIVSAAKITIKGMKEGVKEGLREAPKKATKTVVTGAGLLATKRLLDSVVGKEESARIFQAANNKKISSFWKVHGEDKEEDD